MDETIGVNVSLAVFYPRGSRPNVNMMLIAPDGTAHDNTSDTTEYIDDTVIRKAALIVVGKSQVMNGPLTGIFSNCQIQT